MKWCIHYCADVHNGLRIYVVNFRRDEKNKKINKNIEFTELVGGFIVFSLFQLAFLQLEDFFKRNQPETLCFNVSWSLCNFRDAFLQKRFEMLKAADDSDKLPRNHLWCGCSGTDEWLPAFLTRARLLVFEVGAFLIKRNLVGCVQTEKKII